MYFGNASTTQKKSSTTRRHASYGKSPPAVVVNRGASSTAAQSGRSDSIISSAQPGCADSVSSRLTERWCCVRDGGRVTRLLTVVTGALLVRGPPVSAPFTAGQDGCFMERARPVDLVTP